MTGGVYLTPGKKTSANIIYYIIRIHLQYPEGIYGGINGILQLVISAYKII